MKGLLAMGTVRILNLDELKEEVLKVCKECDCEYNYMSDGFIRIDTDRDWEKAKKFMARFKELYEPKYPVVIHKMWDILDSASTGSLYSNNLNELFQVHLKGNSVVHINLPEYKGTVEDAKKDVMKIFLNTCKRMNLSDTNGDLSKSIRVFKNKRFLKVYIEFDRAGTAERFVANWYEVIKQGVTSENSNCLQYMFTNKYEQLTNGNAVIEGWVYVEKE